MKRIKFIKTLLSFYALILALSFFVFNPIMFNHNWALGIQNTPTPNPELFNVALNDTDCIHPCWFGIILGVSTESDVELFFDGYFQEAVGPVIKDYEIDEKYSVYGASISTLDQEWLNNRSVSEDYTWQLNFIVDKEADKVVEVYIEIPFVENQTIDWTRMAPNHVLQTYGTPKKVSFIRPEMMNSPLQGMMFHYPSIGLFISYPTVFERSNNRHTFCNTLDGMVGHFVVWGRLPTDDNPIDNQIVSYINDRRIIGSLTLQDVTTLTYEEFTSIFSNPDQTCITTIPEKLWIKLSW